MRNMSHIGRILTQKLQTAFIILHNDLNTNDKVESFSEELDARDVDGFRGNQAN